MNLKLKIAVHWEKKWSQNGSLREPFGAVLENSSPKGAISTPFFSQCAPMNSPLAKSSKVCQISDFWEQHLYKCHRAALSQVITHTDYWRLCKVSAAAWGTENHAIKQADKCSRLSIVQIFICLELNWTELRSASWSKIAWFQHMRIHSDK